MDLDGTIGIVTGGGSGIGAACARAMAARGVRVVVVDRDGEKARSTAAEVLGHGIEADVSDEVAVEEAVSAASELGPLRVLVNAAGIGTAFRTVDRAGAPVDLKKFERVVRVNLTGTFNCIRLAAAEMARTEPQGPDACRGAIVNIASVAAFDGQIGQTAYSASKAGVVGMTLPLARELASVGVRVNTVAPGLIDTPIYGTGEEADKFKSSLGASVVYPPRLGRDCELASMVLEVLSNDYVNGETIRVDGALRLAPR